MIIAVAKIGQMERRCFIGTFTDETELREHLREVRIWSNFPIWFATVAKGLRKPRGEDATWKSLR